MSQRRWLSVKVEYLAEIYSVCGLYANSSIMAPRIFLGAENCFSICNPSWICLVLTRDRTLMEVDLYLSPSGGELLSGMH